MCDSWGFTPSESTAKYLKLEGLPCEHGEITFTHVRGSVTLYVDKIHRCDIHTYVGKLPSGSYRLKEGVITSHDGFLCELPNSTIERCEIKLPTWSHA